MTEPLAVGGQLGSYLIESVIGRGGMSTVYRARHTRLGTDVAVKVLASELSTDDTFRERFLREAKMAAGIDHPNVVPIYDTGLQDGVLFMVMRYVAGGDLKAMLRSAGRLDAEQTLGILEPVARALDAAHSHGLVHRDVKPANVLLARAADGTVEHVYLSDFGITKHAGSVSGLTGTGALVGTVDYMAPEQIESGQVTSRTDIYALGCVFYQCLTGRVPFDRDGDAAVLWAHVRDVPEPPSAVDGATPRALDGPILRAMAKEPADRFASCREFTSACRTALAGRAAPTEAELPAPVLPPAEARPAAPPTVASGAPPPPPPPDTPPRERPWIARHGWVLALGAVLVAGAFAAGIALSGGGSSNSKSRSTAGTPRVAGAAFPGDLTPVPTNRVSGTGHAKIRLDGTRATVTIDTNGLLDGAPHAMHIHEGTRGICPPASAAHDHNGHQTIATTDGIPYYGPPHVAITTRGDISLNSILAFKRFPSTGEIRYRRTFTIPADVARAIQRNNAVIVVHGIDYNHNGLYDGVLDRSELDRNVPGEATAPALCGPLRGAAPGKQHASVAGGGSHGRVFTASLAVQPADRPFVCLLT